MKKLRLTHHSALVLGLRRLLARTWPAAPEHQCQCQRPVPIPGGDPVDAVPATSFAQWIFAGLLVAGAVAVKACMDGSKGETRTMNLQFLLAALVGTVALIAHVYNFEALIWPKLRTDCLPTTPFASPAKVKTLYREHWHFLTVSWLLTIGVMLFVTFGDIIPYANLIVLLLIGYWISIVIAIFFIIGISLLPGESYLATLAKSLQWVIILIVVGLMFWGFSQ
jgi:hypothetical protein